jgi:hypothetical protein
MWWLAIRLHIHSAVHYMGKGLKPIWYSRIQYRPTNGYVTISPRGRATWIYIYNTGTSAGGEYTEEKRQMQAKQNLENHILTSLFSNNKMSTSRDHDMGTLVLITQSRSQMPNECKANNTCQSMTEKKTNKLPITIQTRKTLHWTMCLIT